MVGLRSARAAKQVANRSAASLSVGAMAARAWAPVITSDNEYYVNFIGSNIVD